jgi:hypothetical protein
MFCASIVDKYFVMWWTALVAASKDPNNNDIIKQLLVRQDMQTQILERWSPPVGTAQLIATETPTDELKTMFEQHIAKVTHPNVNSMSTLCRHSVNTASTLR